MAALSWPPLQHEFRVWAFSLEPSLGAMESDGNRLSPSMVADLTAALMVGSSYWASTCGRRPAHVPVRRGTVIWIQ